jgi:glutaredoxin
MVVSSVIGRGMEKGRSSQDTGGARPLATAADVVRDRACCARVLSVRIARLVLVVVAVLPAALPGCEERADDGTDPAAAAAEELPPLTLTDATPNLLFTWVDERGRSHTSVTISEVPEEGRERVRVITPTAGHGAQLYVADLRKKNADGSYPVSTLSRAAWEEGIAKRREAHRAKTAPPPPPSAEAAPPAAPGTLTATIYGASWCKPCHAAAAYLRSKGVRVVEHDVEEEPRYAREMQQKLASAGIGGGTIPVIDVGGVVLQGYSPGALDRAIRRARSGGTKL